MAENGESKKANNKDLNKAKAAKKDEFYTQRNVIEDELKHYKEKFKDKTVFCNCDDPDWSYFWRYYYKNFAFLGLKKLISTHYEPNKPSYKLEYDGTLDIQKTPLKENGDFRSPECIELLQEADIISTNPPFSLFKEYLPLLIEHGKKFLIIGNIYAAEYKRIRSHVVNGKIWLGQSIKSGDREFGVPDDYPLEAASFRVDENGKKYIRVKGVRWFTNLEYDKRYTDIPIFQKYTPERYPEYDNYNAIEVKPVADIPIDYKGVMGVPITFLDKYNPDQFEIIGFDSDLPTSDGKSRFYLNGTKKHIRLIIKAKP